jgi:hypothetical protein
METKTVIKFTKFDNGLSDAEVERLALLAEECGEVVQMVGKILRHGYHSYHPRDEARTTNRRLLTNELGNIHVAVELMIDNGDILQSNLESDIATKKQTVWKYLHHQG